MAKGNKRSGNKEAKKPKKVEPKPSAVPSGLADRGRITVAGKKVK